MASPLAMSKTRVLAVLAVAALAAPAFPEEVTRRVGRLVVSVDESSAYPGGLVSVRLRSGLRYGAVHAILEGRRCPFLLSHRGLRALVPVPAAGHVLFAGPVRLTGETVVLDHGQGVVSVFYHLASTPVREGDWVEAGAPLGLTGETGIAAVPHLHWGVYVHGVAVDPHVMETFAD